MTKISKDQGTAVTPGETIAYVKSLDPEGAQKLERLLEKKGSLMEGNVYQEKFTQRQFSLVFDPLLKKALERARMLESIGRGKMSVPALSRELGIPADIVFDHMKELLRRDLVEITGYEERHALYRRK